MVNPAGHAFCAVVKGQKRSTREKKEPETDKRKLAPTA